MAKPIVAWSYSGISMFENCPKKYFEVKIAKSVSDLNQYNIAGDDDHQALEHATGKGMRLPPHLSAMQPLIDKIRAAPGELYVEYKMCLDQSFVPCGYKDWNKAWVRGAGDVLKINGEHCAYLDWKSGKPRDCEDQIELTSLLVFRHFPQVQRVSGGWIHYNHGRTIPHLVERSQEGLLWNGYISRVRALESAIQTSDFPATPNPLCGWCPVRKCAHNSVEERLKREAAKEGRPYP